MFYKLYNMVQKRMLSHEELAIAKRSVERQKKYLISFAFELRKLNMQLKNWTVIAQQKKKDIKKIVKDINDKVEELTKKETLSDFEKYVLESNQYDKDNINEVIAYFEIQINKEHRGLISKIKKTQLYVDEGNFIIKVTQDQINNGVEVKQKNKEQLNEENKNE